ncbi:Aldolase-type TIM barrel [Metarhizium album ARSEF 1941]|uniref:L-lactate dehydrogenase (cytochrome) n=1 Tax=Metarhizium album (strain ARSEF 1941) TaxID=1081103 RepID=A0A0B2WLE2_METAS|nr:Aldolase-type TIM barrel [Metarhizium album ARSEF 1941]KHN93835.1 Aldolase-type TIM barrel [Metarhizium album ARSEF 1941]
MKRKVSVSEILNHSGPDSAWLVVDGNVYDMTDFASSHPGGPDGECRDETDSSALPGPLEPPKPSLQMPKTDVLCCVSPVIHQYSGRDASLPYNQVHAPSLIKSSLDERLHIGTLDTATITEAWTAANTPDPRALAQQAEAAPLKPPLEALISMSDFEKAARQSFTRKAWAYINGASNDNITRDMNRDALNKIWFRSAVMRNVSGVTTKTRLFGCDLDAPLYVSPTGAVRTAGQEGELALARAAGPSGIVHCISTPASYPHDEILRATPEHAFFQLYVDKDRAKSARLLRQMSRNAKVKAIFVTVDLPVVSKREDDERLRAESAAEKQVSPGRDQKGAGLARLSGSFIDPALTWDDIPWIRKHTHLPVVVKGIQRWEDAQTALTLGCEGIVVSNHGGRAADTAQPSIITLLELRSNCPQVFGSMEVLVDGGFRRGSDVVKAICLGASAVGMGRPFLYAVNYGTAGVAHAVALLRDEIETAMRLCGMTSLMDDAGPDFLNTGAVDHLVHRQSYIIPFSHTMLPKNPADPFKGRNSCSGQDYHPNRHTSTLAQDPSGSAANILHCCHGAG